MFKVNLQKVDMEPKWYTRVLDLLLVPIMFLLNGGAFPLQETHHWHTLNVSGDLFPNNFGLSVKGDDKKAKFSHDAPIGLYHMPIFGGLRKYVVIGVSDFEDWWHVVFKHGDKAQIHRLRLVGNKLKLLVGKEDKRFFALDKTGNILPLRVVGFGKIGDNKYKGVRLL